jgi:hypothetical protein
MQRLTPSIGRWIRWVRDHTLRSAAIALGIALFGILEAILMGVFMGTLFLGEVAYYWFRYGDSTDHPPLHFVLDNPLAGVVLAVLWFQVRVFVYTGTLAALALITLWIGRRIVTGLRVLASRLGD